MNDDFQTLAITPEFPVDLMMLDRAYRSLQVKYHPDQFLLESEQTLQEATLKASAINDAYRRLKTPLSAAEAFFAYQFDPEYLMHVTGLSEFLFYMLDIGEKIELAASKKDLEQLNHLSDELHQKIDQNYQNLIDGFSEQDQEKTGLAITHWKYLKKALDTLEEKIGIFTLAL